MAKKQTSRPFTGAMTIQMAKKLFDIDAQHSSEWRKTAQEEMEFFDGDQYTNEEKEWARQNNRPTPVLNRTATIINNVVGYEIQNRQRVRANAVEPGDLKPADVLDGGIDWFWNQALSEFAESDAFRDACICGMGWTETSVTYEKNPDGEPMDNYIDPIEMYWDAGARDKNLLDSRRFWRVKSMDIDEAMEKFPNATKTDLNADWTNIDPNSGKLVDQDEARRYEDDDSNASDEQKDELSDAGMRVMIVHCVYLSTTQQWRVVEDSQDPTSGQTVQTESWLDDERWAAYQNDVISQGGVPPVGIKQSKPVWMQCFFGRVLLDSGETPTDRPQFRCITGYRDRKTGCFYAMIRGIRDPQSLANKMASNILHVMNTTAKGGVMAERTAAEDTKDFEESWAKSDQITWLNPGHADRVKPKYVQSVPPDMFRILEYAVSSIRDVPGINLEMLGMRSAIQPIGVEQERKQAGLTILAPLFDSLRLYRIEKGKLIIDLLTKYLGDSRLIRIVGPTGAQYVPLAIKSDQRYDIKMDEVPTGPAMKEKVWAFIGPMLPKLPMPVLSQLLDYAPLPGPVIDNLKQVFASLSQPSPQQQSQQQLEMKKAEADIRMTESSAFDKQASGVQNLVKAGEALVSAIQALTTGMPVGDGSAAPANPGATSPDVSGGATGATNGTGRPA
jgi:hypothetical protein